MSFAYFSDPHIEFNYKQYNQIKKKDDSDYLIVAGDIGKPFKPHYRAFLKQMVDSYKKVFFVLGNHEFYHSFYDDTIKQVQSVVDEINSNFESQKLYFLNRSRIDIDPNLTIIGCTLWSDISAGSIPFAKQLMNDFSLIHDFTTKRYLELHFAERKWLEEALAELKKENDEQHKKQHQQRKVIVVTHHSPTFNNTSHPQYGDDDKGRYCFSTNLEYMLKSPVTAWIFGHTHYSVDRKLDNGVLLLANQVGYPGEERECGYIAGKTLQFTENL